MNNSSLGGGFRTFSKRRALTAMSMCFMFLFSILGSTVYAVPTGISVNSVTPLDGNTMLVARTAANNPLNAPTFQLKADVFINNTSATNQTVSNITVSYPGSGITNNSYTPQVFSNNVGSPLVVTGSGQTLVPVFDGLSRDLPTPVPDTVDIDITFQGDAVPISLSYSLALHDNKNPMKAFFFPAKAEDLPVDQFWQYGTRHVEDSGGGGGQINPTAGSQRYALDMGVVRWNGSAWTSLVSGAPGNIADRDNSDYLVWGVPLYAMGDGTITSCFRGEVDHDPDSFNNITFVNTFGNSLVIRYGDEAVAIAHMMFGSIPNDLCPSNGQNNGLNIPVETGDFLGLVGNTGRSTNAHIHFQVNNVVDTGTDTINGAPMQFLNIRALADDDTVTNLGDSPDLKALHNKTLHSNSLILPNTCGMDIPDAGFIEVSRHGIEAECYQDVFNLIVSRGYRPVFVDGYDVGGDTFFNATFRTGGPSSWVARHGLTATEYQDLFDDLTGDGFRLQQIDAYLQNGNIRFAAIFEVRDGPDFAAFHNLTDSEYSDRVDELADDGFVPINVSTVEVGGQAFWTGLFEDLDVNGWTVETVDDADYQDTFDANFDAGRILIYVHGFDFNGAQRLTGIFVDPIDDGTAAIHGFTSSEYQTEFDINLGNGLLTRYNTGYDNGAGSARFAALWRGRLNTTITSGPSSQTNLDSASFSFKASVPFAVFDCQLDGGAIAPCTSSKDYTSLSEGNHTFNVVATDRESVKDLSPASETWLVDLTPPDVNITFPGPTQKQVHGELVDDLVTVPTIIGWGDLVATATDNLTGVASVTFEIDGVDVSADIVEGPAGTFTYLFEPEINGENVYTLEVTATDGVGNSAITSLKITGVATGKKMK